MDRTLKIVTLALEERRRRGLGDGRLVMGEAWIIAARLAKRKGAEATFALRVVEELGRTTDDDRPEEICATAALELSVDASPDRDDDERDLAARVGSAMLKRLTGREERTLRLRHGLSGGEPLTLWDIADQFGIGQERLRQIEQKAMRKLRHPSANLGPVLPDACRAHIAARKFEEKLRRERLEQERLKRQEARAAEPETPARHVPPPVRVVPHAPHAAVAPPPVPAPVTRRRTPVHPAAGRLDDVDAVAGWILARLRPLSLDRVMAWIATGRNWHRMRLDAYEIADDALLGAELYVSGRTLGATALHVDGKITATAITLPMNLETARTRVSWADAATSLIDHPLCAGRWIRGVATSDRHTTASTTAVGTTPWNPSDLEPVGYTDDEIEAACTSLVEELRPDVLAMHHLEGLSGPARLDMLSSFAAAAIGHSVEIGRITYYRSAAGLSSKGWVARDDRWRDGALVIGDWNARAKARGSSIGQDFRQAYDHPAFEGCVVAEVSHGGTVKLSLIHI